MKRIKISAESMDALHAEALRGDLHSSIYNRGSYYEITTIPARLRELLLELDSVAWTTGIESDRKRRGSSINTSVYSIDFPRGLAVVQVRQCVFHPRRFNRVRKDYYLVGRNENGNPFAHPVEFRAAGRAVGEDLAAGVRIALARIWRCDEDDLTGIVRNGDVAFIPEVRLPADALPVEDNAVLLRETHHVRAVDGQLYKSRDGYYYVQGRAVIEHTKRQHKAARVRGGVWRVQEGIRGDVWGFTSPTAD